MKGTEKQIAWASSLIETMECRFNQILDECKQSQPHEYDNVNLLLGTVKEMFNNATYAGDIITLLKDNHKSAGMEYYNVLFRSISSSTLPFAKEV